LRAEAEVGDRVGAGLLRVVEEVALGGVRGVVADDLDGVLVGADGAVRAEAVEEALDLALGIDGEVPVEVQAHAGHVVVHADGELVLGARLLKLVVDRHDHGRGELGRTEAVAAADDGGPALEGALAGAHGLADGGADVLVEGLADGSGLLGPVEDGDGLGGGGQGLDEVLDAEGTEEVHLEDADLLALLDEVVDGLLGDVRAGAHHDDDALGVGGADVVEEVVGPAGELAELLELALDDGGNGGVELVRALAGGEVDVGVLAGAADLRVLGREASGAVGAHELVGDHLLHDVVGDLLDLGHLVGGAEAVEEVEEGHAGLEGRGMGDEGEVHDLLDVVGGEHGPAGLAAGHDVLVVAVDGQSMSRDGAGGDVEDGRDLLARDLVHVRDHEEEALRRGEGRREGSRSEGAVHGASGAGLGLEFDDLGNGAPDVLAALGGELVGDLAHRGGGRDRVDRDDLAHGVGHVGGGGVAVDHGHFLGIGHTGSLMLGVGDRPLGGRVKI